MEGPYVRELKRRGFRLRFGNRRLESEYQSHAAGRHSRDLRIQLLLGGAMICVLCLLDFLLLERDLALSAITLRLGVMLPPFVLAYALTHVRGGHRFLQPAGVLVGLAVGVTSLVIGDLGRSYAMPDLFAGYLIIVVFVYFFLGLRVPVAVGTAMTLLVAFIGFSALRNADLTVTTYNAVYLLFLNIVCALGCYHLSKARRTVFLEERILSYRANHDALTLLPNRRAFDEFLDTVWDDANAQSKPVALLMLDIDHFKSYNDLYGHQAGDHALAEVAAIVERSLQRPQDFAGRYGGEEFVVLLFDSTKDYALKLAEDIREKVLAKNIEHHGSGVARCVTVSVGLAYVEPYQSTRSKKGFVQMADEALYAAKEQGRNTVVDADLSVGQTTTGMFRVLKLESEDAVAKALDATVAKT